MTPELAMSRAVKRLTELSSEMQSFLNDWHGLSDSQKRSRVLAFKEKLDNARTLAQNWRLLAEANGLEVPDED